MRTAVAQRNRALDAVTVRLNSGYMRFYSGTRPTNADTALSGNTLLAECRFGATAFGAAAAGVATANSITADSSADAAGTCTFARLFESDGTTVVCDLSVGTSGAEINMNTTTFSVGLSMQIWNFTISMPDGT